MEGMIGCYASSGERGRAGMICDELGVKSYINALDPVAAYGGNLLSPTVLDAMEGSDALLRADG